MSEPRFDLDKLERLEREATPGNWYWSKDDDYRAHYLISSQRLETVLECDHCNEPDTADKNFIVALRNAAPALIAELRAARARIAELESPSKGDPELRVRVLRFRSELKGLSDSTRSAAERCVGRIHSDVALGATVGARAALANFDRVFADFLEEHISALECIAKAKGGVTLDELQRGIHDLAREKGWWDGYERDDQGELKLTTDQLLAKVSLIHAELSEAVEEARKSNDHGMYLGEGGKPEGFVVELADAVIRTLDLCGALGLDLEAAIVAKHEFNKTRPRRHGGKLA